MGITQQSVTMQQMAMQELIKRGARNEIIKRSLLDYLVYDGDGLFQTPNHIVFIANKIQQAFEGKIKRLIISLPPRHGKSEIATKKAPAWYIANNPTKDIIMASYSQEMINDFSRIAKNTFEEHKDIWGIEVAPDKHAMNEWGILGYRGTVKATGIGSGLTGKGANVAIIDDCLKDWEESQSKRQRSLIWDWYRAVLRTRLAPDASIIIIMTRWNTDDLAGRLLEDARNGGEQWEEIRLPAIAEENDPLGRNVGEALWEERFPLQELEIIKRTLGTIMFNALYQQSPTDNDTGMFKNKNFKYWQEEGTFLHLLDDNNDIIKTFLKQDCIKRMTMDTAMKVNKLNDYTSLNVFWETPDKDILFDEIYEDKLEVPDQYPLLTNFYNRYCPLEIGVEDKQSGTGVIQEGIKKGLPIVALKAESDKVTRSSTLSIYYENGKVYHKRNAHWVSKFENQLSGFPNMAHDDMVDTAAYAAIMVRDRTVMTNNKFGKLKSLKIR